MPTLPLLAAETADCPIVATLHSGYPRDRWTEFFRRPLQARLFRASRLLPVSQAALRAVSPLFSGEFRIVPNGVDEEFFAAARTARETREGARSEGIPRRILFIGALVPRKGLPVLLEAFPHVAARAGSIELWIAGDGPGRRRAQKIIGGALNSRVRFLGHCDRHRLRELLAEADLLCAPSLGRESFGMVLLEGMAAGVPVIASDIDGYREVVAHGSDGLLVPPGNVSALASALSLALSDEDLCSRLRRAGEAKAASLRWSRIAQRVEEIYREAAGLPGPPSTATDRSAGSRPCARPRRAR
jgi:phosphatidylinositol alpha-mannosyltransferase